MRKLARAKDDPYYNEHFYFLDTLAQVEAIAIVADLNDGDKIAEKLFETLYDIVGKTKQANLAFIASQIMSQVLNHMPLLPLTAVELILSHFLVKDVAANGTSKNSKLPLVAPTYDLSKGLVTDEKDVMAKHLQVYFSHVMDAIEQPHEDDDEDEDDEDEVVDDDEAAHSLAKLGNLVVEVWKAVPDVVVTVLGEIEHYMRDEKVELRTMATSVVGRILGWEDDRVNFVREHNSAYKVWLGRSRDKDANVRSTWVQHLPEILMARPGVYDEVAGPLESLLNDSDEKVRAAACRGLQRVDADTFIRMFGTFESGPLKALESRLLDKRPSVRNEAFATVGRMYAQGYELIQAGRKSAEKLFGAIPSILLETVYADNKEISDVLDSVLFNDVIPMDVTDAERASRVLQVIRLLTPRTIKVFYALVDRQVQTSSYVLAAINICKKLGVAGVQKGAADANVDKAKLRKTLSSILDYLLPQLRNGPLSLGPFQDLLLKNGKFLTALYKAVSPEGDYNKIRRGITEMVELGKKEAKTMHAFLTSLAYRASFLLFNKTTVVHIIAFTHSNGDDPLYEAAQEALSKIADSMPMLLKPQLEEIALRIANAKSGGEDVVSTLKVASVMFPKYPNDIPKNKAIWTSLATLATQGTIIEAKLATRVLNNAPSRELALTKVLDSVLKNLKDDKTAASQLASFAEMYKIAPEICEDHKLFDVRLLINRLQFNTIEAKASDHEWMDDADLADELRQKLVVLKIFVNRLINIGGDQEAVAKLYKSVFIALYNIISKGGNIVTPAKGGPLPSYFQARLRLEAGKQVLKLATTPLDSLFRVVDMDLLVNLIQDPLADVRARFVRKLIKYLTANKLGPRYLPLVFMTVYEPQEDLQQEVQMWARALHTRLRESKNTALEKSLPGLLQLVGHHQDLFEAVGEASARRPELHSDVDLLSTGEYPKVEDLGKAARYILYYLSIVANQENISLIFYLAQRVKHYRDGAAEQPEYKMSAQLYIMSDLAQLCISAFKDAKGWNVQTFPSSVVLSHTAFTPVAGDVARRLLSKSFIGQEQQSRAEELIRSFIKAPKRKEPTVKKEATSKKDETKRKEPVKKPVKSVIKQKKPAKDSQDQETAPKQGRARTRARSDAEPDEPKQAPSKRRRARAKEDEDSDIEMSDEAEMKPVPARRRSGRQTKAQSYAERGPEDESDPEPQAESQAELEAEPEEEPEAAPAKRRRSGRQSKANEEAEVEPATRRRSGRQSRAKADEPEEELEQEPVPARRRSGRQARTPAESSDTAQTESTRGKKRKSDATDTPPSQRRSRKTDENQDPDGSQQTDTTTKPARRRSARLN